MCAGPKAGPAGPGWLGCVGALEDLFYFFNFFTILYVHRSVQFRTFFEKKLQFHRNSKNEVMRIPRMCSTHKTDFKTSNFYNKIPSRIQIRVA